MYVDELEKALRGLKKDLKGAMVCAIENECYADLLVFVYKLICAYRADIPATDNPQLAEIIATFTAINY